VIRSIGKLALTLVVVAAASVGAAVAFGRRGAPAPASGTEPQSDPALIAQLDRIEARLARVERRPSHEARAATAILQPERAEYDEHDEEDDVSPEERQAQLAEEKRRIQERIRFLESTLARETLDRGWAADAERAMLEVMESAEIAGSRIEELECRSTLCRAEVSHATSRDFDGFSERFLSSLPQLPRGFLHKLSGDDEPVRSVLFMAREGHRMPRPPEASR
jgi:hypothetical protein